MTSFPRLQRAAALALLVPFVAGAQAGGDSSQANQIRAAALKAVTVTATRTATDVRDVAMPVVVIDSLKMRSQLSNGVADLLRGEPGVDVVGTGVNQARPSIRGQRGQRILLLQDGLRLNNSRRQQDFGEIPALVDAEQISRIEVVRGPASVLYGTDAIGGVVNLITRAPRQGNVPLTGRATYSYGTAGTLGRTALSVAGASGRVAYELFGAARVVGEHGRVGELLLGLREGPLDLGDEALGGHGSSLRAHAITSTSASAFRRRFSSSRASTASSAATATSRCSRSAGRVVRRCRSSPGQSTAWISGLWP